MTSQELIQLVAESDPEGLAQFATLMKEAEAEGPEALEDVLSGVGVVASRISEYEKTAAMNLASLKPSSEFMGHAREGAGKALGATAVGVVGGLAAAGAKDLVGHAKRALTKHRNWKRLLEHNPAWKHGRWDEHNEMSAEHKTKLPKAFDTVHRLAPGVAADPITASVYVRQLASNPEAHDTLKRLVDTQKAINDSKSEFRTLK